MSKGDKTIRSLIFIVAGLVILGLVLSLQQVIKFSDDEPEQVAPVGQDVGANEPRVTIRAGPALKHGKAQAGAEAKVRFPRPTKALDAIARKQMRHKCDPFYDAASFAHLYCQAEVYRKRERGGSACRRMIKRSLQIIRSGEWIPTEIKGGNASIEEFLRNILIAKGR